MSERETFLARWSRRKQASVVGPADADPCAAPNPSEQQIEGPTEGASAAAGLHEADVASAARDPDAIVPLFDTASLPPIESITGDTDIRAFLAPGVPPELARAALRRAWAADPRIRDFVGLADYDWDFNAPGSMAGFGPLEMTEELRRIAAAITGPRSFAEPAAARTESSDPSGEVGSHGRNAPPELLHEISDQLADVDAPSSERDPPVTAVQNQPDAAEESQLVVQPRHGGALPK
jgi:hypothetical protein